MFVEYNWTKPVPDAAPLKAIFKYTAGEFKTFHLLNGTNQTPSEAALKKLKDEMEELW